MSRGKLVSLRQLSGGAPEQWEGVLENGDEVFVRERGGFARVEVNGTTIVDGRRCEDGCLALLAEMFDLPPEEP
jgi:hypothetical protein